MAEYLPVIAIGAVMVAVTVVINWARGRSNNKDKAA